VKNMSWQSSAAIGFGLSALIWLAASLVPIPKTARLVMGVGGGRPSPELDVILARLRLQSRLNAFAAFGTAVSALFQGLALIAGAIVFTSDSYKDNGTRLQDTPALALFTQQGLKLTGNLVPTPGRRSAELGSSVALSADGKIALVGAPLDSLDIGAAYVFTRTDGAWTQQAKLVGGGAIRTPDSFEGSSVSLSADGLTAAVGAPGDNSNTGAVWIFSRRGNIWTQQAKLVGAGSAQGESSWQAVSVGLSADGNTVLVGAPGSIDKSLA
jgi:FG-GAP repeat